MVLVFVFLKENETVRMDIEAGWIPDLVDGQGYLEALRNELGSDETLRAIQRELNRHGRGLNSPVWWLRSRVEVKSSSIGDGFAKVHVTVTHHTMRGQDELRYAFEAVAERVVPKVREKYVIEWSKAVERRLKEVGQAIADWEEEQRKGDAVGLDVPFADERDQLADDLWLMANEEGTVGVELRLPGTFAGYGPWWKPVPPWAILIAKCTGYGLLAAFPAVFLFEMVRPRR